jgi:hypothetical protein
MYVASSGPSRYLKKKFFLCDFVFLFLTAQFAKELGVKFDEVEESSGTTVSGHSRFQ